MKREEINNLLDKYLAQQATADEVKLIEAWYESFETRKGIVEQLSKEEIEQSMQVGFGHIRNVLESKK